MMSMLPVLQALRFHGQSTGLLEGITPAGWRDVLAIVDRERLTLPLAIRCHDALPPAVAARLDGNLAANAERHSRLVAAHAEIADLLRSRDIEFVVLKGLSHWPYYSANPAHRPQYDIDLYCPEHLTAPALQALESLGYEALQHGAGAATDHLPVMIRKTGWKWRGDYFDPEMPFPVELHFRFWDRRTERFTAPGIERFWGGRTMREISGLCLPTLGPADGLTYTALHLARHLFRGDLRLYQVYELAHFLEFSASQDAFWGQWESRRADLPHDLPDDLPDKNAHHIEAIAFRLASEWFHCRLHPAARAAVERLPRHVKRWFQLFALSPVASIDCPNKNELWLHWCLVNGVADRGAIALRRLFPLRSKRLAFETRFILGRALHHTRSLVPVIRDGMRWWFAPPHIR